MCVHKVVDSLKCRTLTKEGARADPGIFNGGGGGNEII